MTLPKPFRVRFGATCALCDESIHVRHLAVYIANKTLAHVACVPRDDDGGVQAAWVRPRKLRAQHVARRRVEPLADAAVPMRDLVPVELPRTHAGDRRAPVIRGILDERFPARGAGEAPQRTVLYEHAKCRRMRRPDPEEASVRREPGSDALLQLHTALSMRLPARHVYRHMHARA